MDNFNAKTILSDEKGITLAVLVLTIVVMFILAAVSIQTGSESLDSTRLQGFYTQLEIIQKRVDDIATTNESYKDAEGNTIYLKDKGEEVTDNQIVFLQRILSNLLYDDDDAKEFRYFTAEDLENELDLINMEYDVFIHFDNRIVVAEDGIVANGVRYNALENTTYFVKQSVENNDEGNIKLDYKVTKYGSKYKVVVVPTYNNMDDLSENGYVKYKKIDTKYWETSDNTEMIVELDTEYNIVYIDSNNNNIEGNIIVKLVKDEEGNDNLTVTNSIQNEESEEN